MFGLVCTTRLPVGLGQMARLQLDLFASELVVSPRMCVCVCVCVCKRGCVCVVDNKVDYACLVISKKWGH